MTQTQTKQRNKGRADPNWRTWDSAIECAFLRLSSILLEIIYSDSEGEKNAVEGGDVAIQLKKRLIMAKK